jgi:hypothetical protein
VGAAFDLGLIVADFLPGITFTRKANFVLATQRTGVAS